MQRDESEAASSASYMERKRADVGSICVVVVVTAYYVAFGPHGPRKAVTPPGTIPKIIVGVAASLAVTAAIFFSIRARGKSPARLLARRRRPALRRAAPRPSPLLACDAR